MTLHSRFHAQGGARVLFANKIFKIYLLMVLSLIRELRFNVSVNMSGSGAVGIGVGVGSYQLGVYVPLKALFLVSVSCTCTKSCKHNY